ncbi:hypothetical protein XENOCAPTIV_017530, partial [Xenoophorus captivus]
GLWARGWTQVGAFPFTSLGLSRLVGLSPSVHLIPGFCIEPMPAQWVVLPLPCWAVLLPGASEVPSVFSCAPGLELTVPLLLLGLPSVSGICCLCQGSSCQK